MTCARPRKLSRGQNPNTFPFMLGFPMSVPLQPDTFQFLVPFVRWDGFLWYEILILYDDILFVNIYGTKPQSSLLFTMQIVLLGFSIGLYCMETNHICCLLFVSCCCSILKYHCFISRSSSVIKMLSVTKTLCRYRFVDCGTWTSFCNVTCSLVGVSILATYALRLNLILTQRFIHGQIDLASSCSFTTYTNVRCPSKPMDHR